MMMKLKADELNSATVQGRTCVVNKSEPKPEGERRSFNNNRGGEFSRWLWWKQPWWRNRGGGNREDINIFSTI
jgi:hypothetical protein